MAIDTSGMLYGKKTVGALARGWRRAEKDAALEKAYRKVDLRDASVCWVTGKTLTPGAHMDEFRREHHHLNGRIGKHLTAVAGIITVSAKVHHLLTRNVLLPLSRDARTPILFAWNRNLVRRGSEPFRLRAAVDGEKAA